MLIFSMAVFGTLGLFVRSIPLPSAELALWRAVLAALLIGLYLLLTRQPLPLRSLGRDLPLLLLSGVAMGFNWILLFEAYRYTTVSVATLSYYFAPVLVTLACPLLFRERITARGWVCFAASSLGLVLVTGIGDTSCGTSHLTGILFGLGAATLYATVILLNKFIRRVGGIQRTFLQFLAAILVLLPYVLLQGDLQVGALNTTGWILLAVVGLFHTGVTYCLYFSSLRELPGQKAAILSYIDPLLAVLLSVLVLHEPMSLPQIAGGILILGFTLLNELPGKKKPEKTE
jgi:drug/metabolite transporter (DMT)-like permease